MLKDISLRLKSSLILAPAILLLLVWIGLFAGADAVNKMGLWNFVLSAAVASVVLAYSITLYVTYLQSRITRK